MMGVSRTLRDKFSIYVNLIKLDVTYGTFGPAHIFEIGNSLPADTKIYAGGEGVFCPRYFELPGGNIESWGALDRRSIKEAGVNLVMSE
jgi:hypothetical protein